ncbi:MAG: polysaccharide biosynthesis tyrosine autokinase, partial [Calditrichia bacterium]|nr:polysaccharide biosynthesis tyrosine autokinase [Calditrichia bacterium]
PTVVLTGGAQVEVNNINTLQADNEINQRGFEQLQDAVNRINQTKTLNDKVLVARELLNIANGLGFTTSTILEENLNNKFNEYQDLLEEYPEEHQYVIEAQNEVSEIINRALAFGKNNSLELNDRIQENTSRITSVERHLQYLPAAELQLARFTRDRDITNNTYESIKERYNNARVIEKTASPDVFIIDLALLPSPANNLLNIGITFGGMLLMIVGVPLFLSVLLGYFDNTILSKKEIEKEISPSFIGVIPVIGDISDIPDETELVKRKKIDPKLTTVDYSPSKENEAFRGIRTSIMSEMNYLKEKRVLMVSSHSPGEGKSLIAANVAITFAQNKIPTLLVDADLRRGLLHNMLMVTKSPGLSNILASNVNINGSILDKVIQKSQIPNLFIMSCGDTFPNPAEMIGSKKMENLINLISKKFGIIIFDTAPMGVASDSLNLVKNMDATLLVTMAKKTKINSFVKIYKHIEKIRKGNIIGVVLNGTDGELIKDKYGYSYYHY